MPSTLQLCRRRAIITITQLAVAFGSSNPAYGLLPAPLEQPPKAEATSRRQLETGNKNQENSEYFAPETSGGFGCSAWTWLAFARTNKRNEGLTFESVLADESPSKPRKRDI